MSEAALARRLQEVLGLSATAVDPAGALTAAGTYELESRVAPASHSCRFVSA